MSNPACTPSKLQTTIPEQLAFPVVDERLPRRSAGTRCAMIACDQLEMLQFAIPVLLNSTTLLRGLYPRSMRRPPAKPPTRETAPVCSQQSTAGPTTMVPSLHLGIVAAGKHRSLSAHHFQSSVMSPYSHMPCLSSFACDSTSLRCFRYDACCALRSHALSFFGTMP